MRRSEGRRKVLIVRRYVPHYRVAFYEILRNDLRDRGIDLTVVYSDPEAGTERDGATTELAWGRRADSVVLHVRGKELWWQPVLNLARQADLVVVEQATRLLVNYPLLAWQSVGGPKLAFWGHGRDFQSRNRGSAGERLKRAVSLLPHWWFAYNELSADIVQGLGYPPARITSIDNAIDTRALVAARTAITDEDRRLVRDELGLSGRHVGIYCGGLYDDKRVPVLLAAARQIREALPDFELVVIGDGSDAGLVRDAAARHPWIHHLGYVFGSERVRYFAVADVFLLPGLVGLAVLDSFALGVPLVTSAAGMHSPEIAYLEDGVNGLLVEDGGDAGVYAKVVVELLLDRQRLAKLREGCLASASRYTIENMAQRFAEGVQQALDASPRAEAAARYRRWGGWRTRARTKRGLLRR